MKALLYIMRPNLQISISIQMEYMVPQFSPSKDHHATFT